MLQDLARASFQSRKPEFRVYAPGFRRWFHEREGKSHDWPAAAEGSLHMLRVLSRGVERTSISCGRTGIAASL